MRTFKHKKKGIMVSNSSGSTNYTRVGLSLPNWLVEDSNEWEEVVEKDYEILEISFSDGQPCPYSFFGYGTYKSKKEFIEAFLNAKACNYKIHSVKRLSDGEVFTVGDYVGGNFTSFIISNIIIDESGNLIAGSKLNSRECHITGKVGILKHIKKPLFTTEDGVDIFEDDVYYFVNIKTWIFGDNVGIFIKDIELYHSYRYFSTKKAAEKYILMNAPRLSINDVMSVAYNPVESKTSSTKKLKEIVKSKL